MVVRIAREGPQRPWDCFFVLFWLVGGWYTLSSIMMEVENYPYFKGSSSFKGPCSTSMIMGGRVECCLKPKKNPSRIFRCWMFWCNPLVISNKMNIVCILCSRTGFDLTRIHSVSWIINVWFMICQFIFVGLIGDLWAICGEVKKKQTNGSTWMICVLFRWPFLWFSSPAINFSP